MGKSIKEAEKILKDSGLTIFVENESEELTKDKIIIEQTPKANIKVKKENKICVRYK